MLVACVCVCVCRSGGVLVACVCVCVCRNGGVLVPGVGPSAVIRSATSPPNKSA